VVKLPRDYGARGPGPLAGENQETSPVLCAYDPSGVSCRRGCTPLAQVPAPEGGRSSRPGTLRPRSAEKTAGMQVCPWSCAWTRPQDGYGIEGKGPRALVRASRGFDTGRTGLRKRSQRRGPKAPSRGFGAPLPPLHQAVLDVEEIEDSAHCVVYEVSYGLGSGVEGGHGDVDDSTQV
jgi:hypothetical protein